MRYTVLFMILKMRNEEHQWLESYTRTQISTRNTWEMGHFQEDPINQAETQSVY